MVKMRIRERTTILFSRRFFSGGSFLKLKIFRANKKKEIHESKRERLKIIYLFYSLSLWIYCDSIMNLLNTPYFMVLLVYFIE